MQTYYCDCIDDHGDNNGRECSSGDKCCQTHE